jgi:uncharacterized protein
MQFNLDSPHGQNTINNYQPGQITINQIIYKSSVIISPTQLITAWPPQQFAELTPDSFNPVLALNPEIIILGTGATHLFPPPELIVALIEKQIGFEAMNTGAASRTYNVLVSEGRNVVAALLL